MINIDELVDNKHHSPEAKLEISEIWKFAAAISISCAISLFGTYMTNGNKYTSETMVKDMIDAKHMIVENEMKHYGKALDQLTTVVDNNTKVLYEIKEELAASRALREKK